MDDISQDYINQAVTLSAESIRNFYTKVLEISTQVDITDSEIVANIHKLSSVAKGLVYSHTTLCDYAKVEVVKAAIKTLNGVQAYLAEANGNVSQDVKQETLDVLIDYLQVVSKDEQLDLFEL